MQIYITAVVCMLFVCVTGCSTKPLHVTGVVWDVEQVDVRPKATKYETPYFPGEKRGRLMRGKVTIQIVVTTDGQVADPVVLSSSDDYFVGPAVDAICKWRFKPAQKDGVVVNCRMKVPMSLSIDGRL
jgi:TonB family protein